MVAAGGTHLPREGLTCRGRDSPAAGGTHPVREGLTRCGRDSPAGGAYPAGRGAGAEPRISPGGQPQFKMGITLSQDGKVSAGLPLF